jgi:hypothetical protein
MDGQGRITNAYNEWQISNLKFGSWAKKSGEESDKIGLEYI